LQELFKNENKQHRSMIFFHSDHSRYYYRFLLNVGSSINYTFKTKMVSKTLITSPFSHFLFLL